jgi:integrase
VARLILDKGMRPDEVMRLERRGVDLQSGRVTIFQGKTNAARRKLKLSAQSLMIVERRMQENPTSRWLFPSPKRPGEPLTKLNG